MQSTGQKPFLRWAGSKRQLVPILMRYWSPGHRRYVEPFSGSACLFFSLSPARALLGDINSELVLTYQAVSNGPDQVAAELSKLPNCPNFYTELRRKTPSELPIYERAARFIYLNKYCFNGLYRTNRSGQFNVPYGGRKCGAPPSEGELRACSNLLRNAEVYCEDFSELLKRTEPGDFVYMDPPFSIAHRRTFHQYNGTGFSAGDLERVRSCMEDLAERGITFLVSYGESAEATILQEGFHQLTVPVRRSIAAITSRREIAREVLISNRPHP